MVTTRPRRRHEALVHQHLEGVSRVLLEEHPDVVRKFIGRNAGVYALYRKNKLYYVGLATGLAARLKAHIKDRHGRSWDSFSIFLTIKDQHLKEIESLLLQIARPPGNRVGGNPTGSKNMRRWVQRAIREKQKLEVSSLLAPRRRKNGEKAVLAKLNDKLDLAKLLPKGARLKGSNKGIIYRATAKPDGQVRYNGHVYSSLSNAAQAALGRRMNGWWFWQVERGRGNWVRMTKIREAGTIVYAR